MTDHPALPFGYYVAIPDAPDVKGVRPGVVEFAPEGTPHWRNVHDSRMAHDPRDLGYRLVPLSSLPAIPDPAGAIQLACAALKAVCDCVEDLPVVGPRGLRIPAREALRALEDLTPAGKEGRVMEKAIAALETAKQMLPPWHLMGDEHKAAEVEYNEAIAAVSAAGKEGGR